VVPYCNIFRFFKIFNRMGIPMMLYLHPWEFDKQQPRIDLPLNRKFMHYFNCKVTPVKVEKLLQHFNFTTVENVLALEGVGGTSSVPTKDPKIHKEYVISSILTIIGFLLLYIMLFTTPKFMGWYALTLIVIGVTILYWPWTTISNFIESLKNRIKK
jgi:hypothetical protein